MTHIKLFLTVVIAVACVGVAHGETAIVNVPAEDVSTSDSVLTISVTPPSATIGKRVDRAFLEVVIEIDESANDDFNDFPILELYQEGSEMPKQTLLLSAGHDGVVRLDVTRFVRGWSGNEARTFVLGRVSEDNATAFSLGTDGPWGSAKARLVTRYSNRDGTSVAADVE
ncbi:MAG: hypothetical protein L0Z51_08080 [Candidatus Latescibacteria bacterium]|nr:hypothetical protein [Candidatus Latescibacterota bacterium]